MTPRHENSKYDIILGVGYLNGSNPRCPLCSYSTTRRKTISHFVGIKPQPKKEILEVFVVCKK